MPSKARNENNSERYVEYRVGVLNKGGLRSYQDNKQEFLE